MIQDLNIDAAKSIKDLGLVEMLSILKQEHDKLKKSFDECSKSSVDNEKFRNYLRSLRSDRKRLKSTESEYVVRWIIEEFEKSVK